MIYCDTTWIYTIIDFTSVSNYNFDLYYVIFISVSLLLLGMLMLSSTIFISLLILLMLFFVNILMLYGIGQYLFALFLLGIYVGAILVFFIFVVMSFIFFGKSYKTTSRLWLLFSLIFVFYSIILYMSIYHVTGDDSCFFIHNYFYINAYSIDELQSVGILLFDIDMMYIVIVISLLLLVALIGSITFNASSLVKNISAFYTID